MQQEINRRYIPRKAPVTARPVAARPVAARPPNPVFQSFKNTIVTTRAGKGLRAIWHMILRVIVTTRAGKGLRAIWHMILRVISSLRSAIRITSFRIKSQLLLLQRLLLLPVAILVCWILVAWLRVKVGARLGSINALHRGAIDYVDELAEQYPLSLYPILYKSIQMSYLNQELNDKFAKKPRFIEMAIGEGSMSRRFFPPDANVVALDINTRALRRAALMPHVKDAIICDIMSCPVKPGCFDMLVANNFLHHVTDKEHMLKIWAGLAPISIFNECTEQWKRAWPAPYILERLGCKDWSTRRSARIEDNFNNTFLAENAIDEQVQTHHDIARRESYLSKPVMLLCFLFCVLQRANGPLTGDDARLLLSLCRGLLNPLAMPATRKLAKLLIVWDAVRERSQDAYVSYTLRSRSFLAAADNGYIMCPNCKRDLGGIPKCLACEIEYDRICGMLFLLPRELSHIQEGFNPADQGYYGGSE
jgi:hypothetical protein